MLILIIVKKTEQFTTPFKDDIRQLADLKQKISKKDDIKLQHIAKMSLCREVQYYLLFFYMIYHSPAKFHPNGTTHG